MVDSRLQRRALLALGASGASLAFAGLGAYGAAAQDQSVDGARSGGVERIIVTSRRVEESLQDVPVAVTAFQGDALESRLVEDIIDIQNITPSLTLYQATNSNNSTAAFIRGIGQADQLYSFDPGVGIYIDDVFVNRLQMGFIEALDIDRVEVLRGPQGVLYGKNTNGGAVRFYSQAPEHELSGQIDLTVGSENRTDVRGMINMPIVPGTFAVRANILARSRDGYITQTTTGQTVDDVELLVGRIAGRLELDNFEALLTFDVQDDNSGAPFPTPITPLVISDPVGLYCASIGMAAPCVDTAQPALAPYQTGAELTPLADNNAWGASARLSWSNGPWTATSITAFRDVDLELAFDLDASPLPLFIDFQDQQSEQFSQEFQLAFDNDGPLDVVLGAFYFDETTDFGATQAVDAFLLNPGFVNQVSQSTSSYAAFAHVSYDLTERLAISGGLRYSYEEKDNSNFLRLQHPFFFLPIGTDVGGFIDPATGFPFSADLITGSDSWSDILPRIALEYQATDDTLLYASYSEGFKSGGFNGRFSSGANQQPFYDQETVRTYEIGVKTTWLDNRVRTNIAVFYNDFEGYQATVEVPDPVLGTLQTITNAADFTSFGFEFEWLAQPTDQFTFGGALAYIDSEFSGFINPATGADLSSNELQSTPDWTLSAYVDYTIPIAHWAELSLGADFAYRGSYFTEIDNNPLLFQDDYTLFNARATLRSPNDVWSATLAGRNLGDEAVLVDGRVISGLISVTSADYADPRTWSLTLSRRF